MSGEIPSVATDNNGQPLRDKDGNTVYVTDEMVDNLLNDDTISTNLKKADKKRATLSKEEFHKLRALCKRDLFFLCYSILGNKRLSPNLHGHLCKHIRETENNFRFFEYLLPRGHFKSTIITIGRSIQTVLPYNADDRAHDTYIEEYGELSWPSSLATDCRVLIGHETAESAARFLYAITSHFTSNPLLLALFPEAIPSKRKNRINKWELELPRSDDARGNPEPTIDTLGVGAKSQGRHYNLIDLDDIFGDKARDSAAEATNTLQWFDNIQSFFSTFSQDKLQLVGTRYSTDDVYAHAEENYGKKLDVYCRKVEELDPKTNKLKPIFPEEFSSEDLDILRKNRKVFSAQYNNDPYDGESGFDPSWKRNFFWTGTNTIAAFHADSTVKNTINVRDLDVCIIIDPGTGSSGGFCVTGMDYLGNIYILVAISVDVKPHVLTDIVFKNVVKWQPRTVAVESDLFASTFQYWWASEMTLRGIRFEVTPVHTKKLAKNLRIGGLTQYAEAGKIYLNEAQKELNDEWTKWGKSKNIHILDALAYGPEIWRLGFAPGQRDILESSNGSGSEQLDNRDPLTGYSK